MIKTRHLRMPGLFLTKKLNGAMMTKNMEVMTMGSCKSSYVFVAWSVPYWRGNGLTLSWAF